MEFLLWAAFIGFVLLVLAADLGLFNRHARVITAGEALKFTGVLFAIAMSFSIVVYFIYRNNLTSETAEIGGSRAAWQYLAGYLLELSLSTDNVFVIAVIFSYFRIPPQHQHRVLMWGILGALILRGVMIGLCAELLNHVGWMMYIFGGLLIYVAFRMAVFSSEEVHPDRNILVRLARKFYPVSNELDGEHFFTKIQPADGGPMRRAITPLFLTLLAVETTDVIFAIDSIPAVYGVTREPFIVFTSNVFAILGLRSLYFAVARLVVLFRYLQTSVVILLGFIGLKMIVTHHFHWEPHPVIGLGPIFLILGTGILLSVLIRSPEPEGETPPAE